MHKNKIFLFFSFLVFIFLFSNIVNAACSIGATPLSMEARAIPGQTIFAVWNLYNLHGDRTTHVKLDLIEMPSDWEISFEPESHEAFYSVMGVVQTIEENVALELTPVLKTKPETIPEGMDYVKHPGKEGYIPVKVIKIYIKVPEDAELWKEHDLVLGATGKCFTEPGAVIPGVVTQLKLKVKIISGEFTEIPLEKAPEKEEEKEEVTIIKLAEENAEEKPLIVSQDAAKEPVSQMIEKEVSKGVPIPIFIGITLILLIIIVGIFISLYLKGKP